MARGNEGQLTEAARRESKRLRDFLQEALTYTETRGLLDPRKSFYRASRLYDACAREEVFAGRAMRSVERVIPASLRMTFGQGTAMHEVLQNDLLASAKVLSGRWKCRSCRGMIGGNITKEEWRRLKAYRFARPTLGSPEATDFLDLIARMTENPQLQPEVCPHCGKKRIPREKEPFVFKEYWIGDLETRIGGSMDGFVQFDWTPTPGILEAKSIAQSQLWTIQHAPKPAHMMQATIYMMLTGLKWALVLYWVKGVNGLEGIIPYVIHYSPFELAAIKSKLASIWSGLDDPTAPLPARVCDTASCKRAQVCEFKEECFKERTVVDF